MRKTNSYSVIKKSVSLPRFPQQGGIDLTYRCNNNCRHCWLRIPGDAKEAAEELSFEEIRDIVREAKNMGCSSWDISGGEPMLRPDFVEIFEYITANARSYTLNTNGTLITPKIARLLKKKGSKLIALYGATAKVHDHITRTPGSFETTMAGFNYLKEAGAGFTVQLIPMRDNYHEFKRMIELAESLSKYYRIGAAWLYLSAGGDPEINQEIIRQRLPAREAVELDKPDLSYEEGLSGEVADFGCKPQNEKFLFANCIATRKSFHIDPYGKMSFCCFIKEPSLRYDLRRGNFGDGWDNFIPSLVNKVEATKEYWDNCGCCDLSQHCRYCPVYSYLEHRRFNAKVGYLCAVAEENRKFKEQWQKNHRRYFNIADISLQVDSDLPIGEETFHPKFKLFETDAPGDDLVSIRHHFGLPDLANKELGRELYRHPPWAVYQKNNSWIYLGISPFQENKTLHRVVVFDQAHTRARIYNDKGEVFQKGNLGSLTLFPTDQILLARILADRQGCFLHSCGVIFEKRGLIFCGHSEAGKSTMARMLKGRAEILCDDRIIVRKKESRYKIYGTWSHGDVPDVSANSAPLEAIFFLEKSPDNLIIPIGDPRERVKKVLSCLIRPFVTVDWWHKTLDFLDKLCTDIPCYTLRFNKSGEVVELLKGFDTAKKA